MKTIEERFWSKVEKTNNCWLWKGHLNHKGYGSFYVAPKILRAHRFVYELLVGLIPADMTIDHLCQQPSCVNPEHLEPVTNRINILRGNGFAAEAARKTRCLRGHEFTIRRGRRVCDTCARKRARQFYEVRLSKAGLPQPCACGCGNLARQGNHFIHGHTRRGFPRPLGSGRKPKEHN